MKRSKSYNRDAQNKKNEKQNLFIPEDARFIELEWR